MLTDDFVFYPDYDLGKFRYAVARYIKLLIRTRWKCNPKFLTLEELSTWDLANIDADKWTAPQLLAQAADSLADLNNSFLPRCNSGGVRGTDHTTPVGRLIFSVVGLVPSEGGGPEHNLALRDAMRVLAERKNVDWMALVQWDALPDIRADLDLLPHPVKDETGTRLANIESKLTALVEREMIKDWYTTEEFAKQVGKAEFTVRAWCRNGRVNAQKRHSGRGATPAWVVSHDELLRYQREGLIPVPQRAT